MKLIANENHYQKKVWEQNRIELEIKHETARMTSAELEAEKKRMNRCLDRSFQKYEEHQVTTIYKPDLLRRCALRGRQGWRWMLRSILNLTCALKLTK